MTETKHDHLDYAEAAEAAQRGEGGERQEKVGHHILDRVQREGKMAEQIRPHQQTRPRSPSYQSREPHRHQDDHGQEELKPQEGPEDESAIRLVRHAEVK
jgi:hypothetical protein